MRRLAFVVVLLLLALPLVPPASPAGAAAPVTVGTTGNEPQVVVAPDGTIYVGALQNVYVSTDGGATFRLSNSILDHLSRASDSSLSIDPAGRVYYAADWPYAGITETCTSDDRAATWQCNHVVVPGGTDRMWIDAPTTSTAYLATNEGLYETVILASQDRGASWGLTSETWEILSPQTGPLLTPPGRVAPLLQPVNGWPQGLVFSVYEDLFGPSKAYETGLPLTHGLPSASFSTDGVLYTASETPHGAGFSLTVGRSHDEGKTWTLLPAVPTPGLGTVNFVAVAAGAPGHVGVVFYGTPTAGDPTALPANATWSAWWAESLDADSASPTWSVRLLEADVHQGAMCAAASCTGSQRFAGDFISATFDGADHAHAVWMAEKDGVPTIRYVRP